MKKKLKEGLAINPSTAVESSTELTCPNSECDSKLFFPSIRVRKVSSLMTETGKPGAFTLAGPLLCVKCNYELSDTDFGYVAGESEETDEKEVIITP